MLALVGLMLLVGVALIVVGAVVEGLFWLVIIGAMLILGTAALGWTSRRRGTKV